MIGTIDEAGEDRGESGKRKKKERKEKARIVGFLRMRNWEKKGLIWELCNILFLK